MDFEGFPKIARLTRECVITEKIDGTNASVFIGEDGTFLTGSRTRWITPTDDNYGFAKWAYAHEEELRQLGPGHHFGEWWGQKVQRGYGLTEKRFSLFNVSRWTTRIEQERHGRDLGFDMLEGQTLAPECCSIVPTLFTGPFHCYVVEAFLSHLKVNGSIAAPGFMSPEGVVVYHTAAKQLFKKTLEKDEAPKGRQQ